MYFLISSRSLDFINLMSYGLHDTWEKSLGFNAPLYAKYQLNVDLAVKYWLARGASAYKINLGLGNFGRSFTMSNPAATTPNSGASGPGQAGRVSSKLNQLLNLPVI
jgi:chitinase